MIFFVEFCLFIYVVFFCCFDVFCYGVVFLERVEIMVFVEIGCLSIFGKMKVGFLYSCDVCDSVVVK